jgi:hypothetical protein
MHRTVFRSVMALSVAALVAAIGPARAESRPHVLKGSGQFVSATDFVSEGQATHLGNFTEVGSVEFSGTDDPTILHIEGWAIHTAANGDQVYELISGEVNGLTGAGTATTKFIGGTGRFADATGGATISVQLLGGGAYEFSGEGAIDY